MAALLGLLTPGLGHLYAGLPRTAAVVAVLLLPSVTSLSAAALLAIRRAPLNVWCAVSVVLAWLIGMPLHAALMARRAEPAYELRRYNRWWLYILVVLVVGVGWEGAIRFVLRSRVVQAFRIPSPANEPALLVGDYIFAAKWPAARAVQKDDLVVFRSVETPGLLLVKRVAGLPGDTLWMAAGALHRNGIQLDAAPPRAPSPDQDGLALRTQIRAWQVNRVFGRDTTRYMPTSQEWGPVVIPRDSFFALGDNRLASYDSRHYGFVPLANVMGRPWVVYFSIDPDDGVRGGRIGRRIQ
ncbi:MAG: signal peptidase I [Gemmatimonadetes bacterium]|nr:MAG: signal peptidase I [Gemmatimonadota bacterium]PYP64826.1 MAG: signal peptidase I [Gemmatimonadota bacterium]